MTYILYRQLATKGARAAKLPFAVAMISPTPGSNLLFCLTGAKKRRALSSEGQTCAALWILMLSKTDL